MAFFNEMGKKIAQGSQEAVQKTKNMAEIVKLNSAISEEEKRIKNAYCQMGRIYFETFREAPHELFVQDIVGINDSIMRIAGYTEQIKQIRGVVQCQKCNAEVSYSAPFCSSCGSQMNTHIAETTSVQGIVCTKCGLVVGSDKTFCTNCGQKVEHSDVVLPMAEPVSDIVSAGQNTEPTALKSAQCPACGNDIAPGTAFCLNCGQKIEN